MLYLLIDHKGELGQSDPLTDHGYHAGASAHKALSGYVSDDLVGIEVMAAGTLTKSGEFYYPWWDKNQKTGKHQFLTANRIPASEVVTSGRVANIAPGHYHKYTEAQTLALRKTLCWLHLNDPTVFSLDLILGHDEVSPTRKTDPGAALVVNGSPVSMQAFRDIVKADVAAILARKASA
jgi:N-acetylmuramoyl-L-alanine amidase